MPELCPGLRGEERVTMTTIREMFDETVRLRPGAPAQRFARSGGGWTVRTYVELRDRVAVVAGLLDTLGLGPPGSRMGLMLENGPAWQEIYLALAGTGRTVVPLDPRLQAGEVLHILRDAEVCALFVSAKLRPLVETVLPDLPLLRRLILVDPDQEAPAASVAPLPERMVWDYAALFAAAQPIPAVASWAASPRPAADDLASILYTSGTTGVPKGAMLSHGNFCANVAGTRQAIRLDPDDDYLVVLPLFHAYSFTANFLAPVAMGSCMSFVRSLKTIAEDLRLLRPTMLFTVPLMAEKLYAKVQARIDGSRVARLLLGLGMRRIVARQIIAGLGGRLRLLGVGGAPCPREVAEGFVRLGVPILEGYGLTEAAPGVCYADLGIWKPGTVGRPLPNLEVRLEQPDASGVGELCVRGPSVMKGYYRRPEATAEVIDAEGWLHTGDLVSIGDDGLVRIRGRRKALIVNREGKNIYPEEVEQLIGKSTLFRDVLVLGYTLAHETGERVGAIVTPDPEAVKAHCGGTLLADDEVVALLRREVHACCAVAADYKRPRKIEVRMAPLARTSTMKIRRGVYAGQLDESAAGTR